MQIPLKGLTTGEIFAFLNAAKTHDAPWNEGQMYAYVYDPGKEAMEVGRQAYMAYLVENSLDPSVFPSVLKLETEVVRAVINLLRGGPQAVGNFTTGGTESIILAVKSARDWARANRPEIKEPEIILCQTAHHAFHKAAQYLGLKTVVTPFDPATFRADVEAMRAAITRNTILLIGSAPSYSQGVVDPIPEIASLAQECGLLCHVDACVGGIHLAFMRKAGYSVPEYDFTVPGVTSISTDLHKFGYCPKQASLVLYRDKELRKYQIFTSTGTTCYTLINTTILSTKSGGPVAAAWAVLNYLGEAGYLHIISCVQEAVERMIAGVNAVPGLKVMASPDMCLFAFTSDTINMFQLGDAMSRRGWYIQPQFGKPNAPTNLHVSVHYGTVKRVDDFLAALRESVEEVRTLPPIDTSTIKQELETLIASDDPDLFEKALSLAGVQADGLPQGMAMINTLLEAMPEDVQSYFLIEYFNNLYS